MTFQYTQIIPTPKDVAKSIPFAKGLKKIKENRDAEIKDILEGRSPKLILIVGPCSADDEEAVITYSVLLAKVQEEVKEKLVLIPRIYTNKPRTTGEGYKGMVHQPDPMEKPNIVEGLKAIRRMHIKVVKETGLTSADEMLYPGNYPYLEDLLSYVAIGARSVENQQHRLTVSGIEIPSGMKNPISGDIGVMFNAIRAGQLPHVFIYNGFEVNTSGNLLAHAILRGSKTKYGRNIPNYHYEDLLWVAEHYVQKKLKNPALIVDVNHSNSGKNPTEQPRIAMEVIRNRQQNKLIKDLVKGLMIESYIIGGSQDIGDNVFGQSITDPCLDWKSTETLIKQIAEIV
ncbi:MAG: 3-deoxy-7-phosphoheptulonate synthase [Nitrospinota bacterium]